MVKPSQVKTDHITSEQIGRAHKVYDFQKRENFYLVENSRGEVDDEGNLIEYAVRYSHKHGFTCQCMSGQKGFYNTRYGYCQHVAIACAAASEEKAATDALIRKQLLEDDVITLERLNSYQELASVTPNPQVKASALRVVKQIQTIRGDVALVNGVWQIAQVVAA